MSKRGERIFTLRAASLAIIAGATLYMVAIFVIIALKIIPTATDLQYHTENLKIEFDMIHSRAIALDTATDETRQLLRRETGNSSEPALNVAQDIREKVQTRFDSASAAAPLANITDDMRAAIARTTDSQSEIKVALIEVLSDMETRRYDDAASRLNRVDTLNKVVAERLADVQRLSLADLIEKQKSLGAAADLSMWTVVWWSVGGGALLPVIALFFYRRLYRPLAHLDKGLEQVAGGDLTATVEVRRKDEIGRLGRHFNEMTQAFGHRAEEEHRRAIDLIERFGRILDESSNEIYIFDAEELRFVHVNRGAQENLGYSQEEFSRLTPLDLMPDYDRESFAELVRPLLNGQQERVATSTLHLRKEGSSYPVEVSFRLLSLKEPTVFVAILQDISEQRQAMESLRESRQKYETLVDSINGIVWEGDPQTFGFSFVSQKAERLLGYPVERWLSEPSFWSDHIHPDDRQWALDYCTKAAAANSAHQFEYRMLAADGREVWLRDIVTIVVENDGSRKARGVMIDITERKRAEEALQVSERKYKTIFEYAPVGIYQSSPDGFILTANRTLAEMLGYASADEMLAANLAQDVYLNEEERQKVISRYEPEGHASGLELQWKKKDGTLIWVSLNVHAVKDRENRTQYFEGFVRDVTERKRTEEALRASEELFSKAFHASPVEMSVTRLRDGICLDMNDIALQDTGYIREDVVGKKTSDLELFADPDDPNRVKRFIEDRRPFRNLEFRTRRKNGEVRVNLTSAEIIELGGDECLLLATNDITRRKQMEEALERSEELFSKAFHASPVEMTIIRLKDGCYVDMNESALHRTGYTREELIGRPASALYLLSDPKHSGQEKQLIEARRPFRNLEVRSRRKNGEVRVNLMSAEIIELGGDECLLLAVNDITERKRAEEALRQSEELLDSIINNSTAVIYVKDIDGRYLLINKQYESLFQITLSEIKGKTDHEIFPKEFADTYRANDLQIIEAGTIIESEETAPQSDGLRTYISIKFPLLDSSGNIYATCGISTDITERKRAEEAVRISERKYKDIFEFAPVGIYQSSLDGNILTANQALARMLGYESVDELMKVNLAKDIYLNEEERRKLIREYEPTGFAIALELQWKKKDGTPILVSLNAHTIKDLEGRTQCFEGFVRDITESKKAEEALRASEELFSKAFHASPVEMTILRLRDGICLDMNEIALQSAGYTREETIGRPTSEVNLLVNPDDRDRIRQVIEEGGKIRNLEIKSFRRNGEVRVNLLSAEILDLGGEPCLLVVVNDITRRKRAEEALRASEERFSKAFNASPDPMSLVTLDEGRFIDVNEMFLRLTGYRREEVIGSTAFGLGIWARSEVYKNIVRTLHEQGFIRDLEADFRMKNGELRTHVFSAEIIDLDGQKCVLGQSSDITERKRAEEAVRQQREWLRVTLSSIGDAVITTDTTGRITFMNPVAEAVTGWKEEEAIGRRLGKIFNIINEETREPVENPVEKVMKEGMIVGLANHTLLIARDGREIPIDDSGAPIKDEQENIRGVVLVFHDITERRKTEKALQASEERFSKAFHASPLPMSIGKDLRFIDVNDTLLHNTGYTREEIIGQSAIELGMFSDLDELHKMRQLISEQGAVSNLEMTLLMKNGEAHPHLISAEPIEIGGEECILMVGNDITERKRAEEEQMRLQEAIRESAREWRLTFDAVESLIVILNLEGNVLRLNRAAKEISGINYQKNIGKTIDSLGAGQPWRKAAELALVVRSTHQATSSQVNDESTGRTWDIAASLFTGPEIEEERIIVVARDITRMAELQESLRRSETLYAMGKLVAGVAHEVRNPLFGISATLDAFDVRFGDREEYKRYTTILRGEANRLSQLMQELLDYGKPAALDISEDSIESVMTEVIKACAPLAETAKVRLNGKSTGEFAPILMDRKRIVQVFRNLVENAIQHSPSGGIVEIEAKDVWEGEQRWVECAVRDSGKGLKEEDISRIFDPFFTKRKGGTGLGLSIVQRIVEEHNGKVFAENRREGGTVLTVRFPLARA